MKHFGHFGGNFQSKNLIFFYGDSTMLQEFNFLKYCIYPTMKGIYDNVTVIYDLQYKIILFYNIFEVIANHITVYWKAFVIYVSSMRH